MTLKDAAALVLHQMILNGQLATSICRVLDVWFAWGEVGGMRREDYELVCDDVAAFAQAVLLIALVNQCGREAEGSLASDLQECFRVWKVVRLG